MRQRLNPVALFCLAGWAAAACAETVPPAERSRALVASASGAESCPVRKVHFTRATGCRNDGSVEFCLPKGNAALEAQVRSIAPGVRSSGSRGRAGCDTSAESLFLYPTPGDDRSVCTAAHGALTEQAWREICQLAAVAEIRAVVPTWYE